MPARAGLDQSDPGRLHRLFREDRGRGIGAHAAGVGAALAVEGALVILGAAEQQAGLAIAKREQRGDLALQEFLDHHPRAGGAEPAAQGVVDGGLGLAQGRGDDHALAGRQAVGLDHEGRIEAGEEGLGRAPPR